MNTTLEYINQLEKDKQNLNTMLNNMGVETTGNETFTQLTPLVGKIVTDPILQDKSITITKNGNITIKPDEGYDGLNSINVIVNIEETTPVIEKYVQDGMVAWFDGEDAPNDSNQWLNRLGSDYIYEINGKNLMHKGNRYLNNTTLAMMTSSDYLKQGYTIEVVGNVTNKTNSVATNGGWLFTMNETASWGVGVTNDEGRISFVNNAEKTEEKTFINYYNKIFTGSLYLENVNNRGTTTKDSAKASVNGCEWYSVIETDGEGNLNFGNHAVLCYYARTNGSTYSANGVIYCIRIYNRQLTNEELAHNYELDKIRFGIAE